MAVLWETGAVRRGVVIGGEGGTIRIARWIDAGQQRR
jgi:hypothetical protein